MLTAAALYAGLVGSANADTLGKLVVSKPIGAFADREALVVPGGRLPVIVVTESGPKAVRLEKGVLSAGPVPLFRIDQAPAGALPDTAITERRKPAMLAWLTQPTERYGHAVLGDAVEAGGFAIEIGDGEMRRYSLPNDSVFEDRHVRLIDITGDGFPEALAVRAYLDAGAALAAYDLTGEKIRPLAETPAIGIPNRWLNPIGAADFDGDGRIEVALITTPHIGGVVRLYHLEGRKLREIASQSGYSNHEIGSRALGLSAIEDVDGDGKPEIIVPNQRRSSLVALAYDGQSIREVASIGLPGRIATDIVKFDLDGNGRTDFIVGLHGNRLAAILR